ncbi:SNF2 family helicase [Pyronema omphalodes]|nr:SNF2 family helicase [Pyronema omphalodes]
MSPPLALKRKLETIDLSKVPVVDLSGDTAPPPPKIARTEPPKIACTEPPNQSQAQCPLSREIIDDDEDVLVETTGSEGQQLNVYDHVQSFQGFTAPIVGVRYYNGIISVQEHVNLTREPNNMYDRNAIAVTNIRGEKIGHVSRTLAAKLSPLMDRRQIVLEGTVTGPKGQFEAPCYYQILIPSREPQRSASIAAVKAAKIPGAKLTDEYKAIEQAIKESKKRAAAAAKGRNNRKNPYDGPVTREAWEFGDESVWAASQFPPSQEYGTPGIPEISAAWDQFIDGAQQLINPREVEQLVQRYGNSEDDLQKMPIAFQPDRLKTKMLPYQLQGLAWMLKMEHPQLPKGNEVVGMWKRTTTGKYQNIATMFTTDNPDLPSGGLLADDMGLGKTLQTISLIVADVSQEKVLIPSPKVDEDTCTAGTLIVAPVGVMSNWSDQMAQHISKDQPLNVLRYHQAGKAQAKNLDNYDVVITSYGTLTSDFSNKASQKKGLFSYKWRRIVLDEAHLIRNPASQASLAACGLDAASRWSLTGTPIVNNMKDLFSQVRFLRYSGGIANFETFSRCLIRPLTRGEPAASHLLQILMATVCLRRLKHMKFVDLRLPNITEYIRHVEFHPDERKKYEVLEMEGKGLLQKYIHDANSNSYRFLLEILLRMRQVCNHSALCGERIASLMKLADVQQVSVLNPEHLKALQDFLDLAIEAQEDCTICMEPLNNRNPRITTCKHVFCLDCITKTISMQHKCPLCRSPLDAAKDLIEPAIPTIKKQDPEIPRDPDSSSKIERLMEILTMTHKKNPGTKTVIFSQWTSFLSLLEPFLRKAGIRFSRLDGTLNVKKRDDAVETFTQPGCEVLLASLAVANVGLNLVMANQVIMADSWWAPAVEDQAVDRVYRLGQKREVTVWRLVVERSIEERVIEIQKKKRKMVADAFREGQNKDGRRRTREERVQEIGALLGF